MQEELNQFERNVVLELVPRPNYQSVISTKWVFRNKINENDIIVRNKARLVAQGYNQQEGIDYEEGLGRRLVLLCYHLLELCCSLVPPFVGVVLLPSPTI